MQKFGEIQFSNRRVLSVKKTTLSVIRQKLAYRVKYLRISWTYLDLIYSFRRRIGGDSYPIIRFVARDVAVETS